MNVHKSKLTQLFTNLKSQLLVFATILCSAVLAEARQSVCQIENEDKAYGDLYGRIVERIRLWPGLAPHEAMSNPGRYVYDDGANGWRRRDVSQPEVKFDAKTPPMFMVHGDRDHYSAMGSVALYAELHKRKIPAQLFIYAHGGHGIGRGVNRDGWQDRIVDWINSIGF